MKNIIIGKGKDGVILKLKKLFSYLILSSFLGIYVQPVFADEYMVLPPVNDVKDLPQQNVTKFQENDVSQTLRGVVSTVPVGTSFQVLTNQDLSSTFNKVGEIFTATLNQPISVDGNIVVPEGSEITGQITYLEDAGRAGKNAMMEIKFVSIKPLYGAKVPIMGKVLTKDNTGIIKGGAVKNQLVQNVTTASVATAGGAIAGLGIGALAGEAGVGTLIGATTAGVLGIGYVLWKKGKEIKMSSGTKMIVLLEQPFTVGK